MPLRCCHASCSFPSLTQYVFLIFFDDGPTYTQTRVSDPYPHQTLADRRLVLDDYAPAKRTQDLRPSSQTLRVSSLGSVPPPPPNLKHSAATGDDLTPDLRSNLLQVALQDVTDDIDEAKTSAEWVVLQLAQDEHRRSTSALQKQCEDIRSASSDTESLISNRPSRSENHA